jgi:hypothetical protein
MTAVKDHPGFYLLEQYLAVCAEDDPVQAHIVRRHAVDEQPWEIIAAEVELTVNQCVEMFIAWYDLLLDLLARPRT